MGSDSTPATPTDAAAPSDQDPVKPPASSTKFRYGVKTSLSLTLAYLIPMAIGWPQPQTAATTVMLIAATGLLSESLQKGVSRILGTVAGAIIGLSLIALFPQDRMIYLLAVSITVSTVIYLYNAYQGDSTVFMLTAVVTLMVFNGGDAEGAFLYGVDRAYMTAFGVIVYTVVASMLWPVKSADNTRSLAADLGAGYHKAFQRLVRPQPEAEPPTDEFLATLLADGEAFQTQYASVKNHADGVADYRPEWSAIVSCHQELEALLVTALKAQKLETIAFDHYIDNYDQLIGHLEALFRQVSASWRDQQPTSPAEQLEVRFNPDNLRDCSHLHSAAIASRAELLEQIQKALVDLQSALNSLLFDQAGFSSNRKPEEKPVFVWLDLENLKTALRAFLTFWIAAAIWIHFNPPGGFTFVTMCTVLVVLVSYTPVSPKVLIILLSLGFLFALPAYVFLLPNLTHWLQLAAFLFAYAFIGFYVFQGPVSIFFLLGLFTLGIQNSMSYHVDAILLSMLMFYIICATLIITVHFPFTSKPERLYTSLRQRFFRHCSELALQNGLSSSWTTRFRNLFVGNGDVLLNKMETWGPKIDSSYFSDNSQEQIAALNRACELLHGQLHVLGLRRADFLANPLIAAARRETSGHPIAALCRNLAERGSEQPFEALRMKLANIEERLDEFLGLDYLDRYDARQLAQFYVYLNLQASILGSIQACKEAQEALDWRQLGDTKF